MLLSLTLLSSVITPFLKTFQTQVVISTNWGGYVVTSGLIISQPTVTSVNGSWTVPRVTVTANDTYSAAWVGIGGQEDRTLIQLGTEHDSINGKEVYSAWYETLPDNSITIEEMTISPGDKIEASVNIFDDTTNLFIIEITDITNGQSFSKQIAYNSSRLSAEWIVERPLVNNQITTLADFGSVTFTDVKAQVGGKNGAITTFPYYEVIMSNNQNVPLVNIKFLDKEGSSFTVERLSNVYNFMTR